MSDKLKNILEWIECIVIAIVLALLIRYYVGTPTVVQMDSMYPTLKQGERLVLNRIPRTRKQLPKRGDIITFEQPSVTYIGEDKVDLSNPVAIYDKEPTNVFSKFAYYVLEWGKTSYIKRVIGLPGEHVQIMDGKVYINGSVLEDDVSEDDILTAGLAAGELTLGENEYFVLGDNRNNSEDSRFANVGVVKKDDIVGSVWFIASPMKRMRLL